MQQIDITELGKEDVFGLIGKEWGLVTAGRKEKFNMMTISWGALGELWGKHVAIVYIRPERYTHEFIEQQSRLTLSFLGEKGHEAYKICGTKSGRDFNKAEAAGLQPVILADDLITYEQARLTLVCRKMYKGRFEPDHFLDKAQLERWYNDQLGGGLHDIYFLEIETVYKA